KSLTEPLVALGAEAKNSPAEVVKSSGVEIVITMLPASIHVKEVYLGENGILKNIPRGICLIDSSTIDPRTARDVAKKSESQGNPMLDAPVSGGTGGAQSGTLTFMVGGDERIFNMAKPILTNMGKNIVHCGPSGNGQVAKVANNMLLGISMIGVAEAMSLGVSMGMDPNILAGIINSSSGRCWSSEIYNPYPGVVANAPSSRNYTGGFGTDLMIKDLGLATEAAAQINQPATMVTTALKLYKDLSFQGDGALDFSAIIKLINKKIS
ncbi:MAG: 3-hydroxyisobutyrate dehydrogenase, partial [Pseudomonadota bacterium]